MATRIESLLVFAICFVNLFCSKSSQVVCVVPDGYIETPPHCDHITNIRKFCQDFQSNDTLVQFIEGDREHALNTTCKVKNIQNLYFDAYNETNGAVIRCFNKSGFQFINVNGLSISHINFDGCGSKHIISFNLTGLIPVVIIISIALC